MANTKDDKKTVADLIAVMAALRTPVTGCPWDLKQTFETIAPYTIEEAYEVADAIAREDMEHVREELGDLLLQVVYHSRIAEEEGHFQFDDVVDGIVDKMVRRHPHVFGSEAERAAGAADGFWDRIKEQERAEKETSSSSSDDRAPASTLANVPVGLPALTRAIKLQNKAAKVGFDWPSFTPVFSKLREELGELEAAIAEVEANATGNGQQAADRSHIEEEFGDLLFVIANVGRHLKLDPEAALRQANQKFISRFHFIEQSLHKDGRSPATSTLEEMDALWDKAKAQERGQGSSS